MLWRSSHSLEVDSQIPSIVAGNDLTSLRGPKTARACYRACEKTKGCAAFTFIASQEKTAPKSKCWLKKAGYHRGAEHAVGTVSGVVRRE